MRGKAAVIVDIVDANRVIVDGPVHGIKRQVLNLKRATLTDFVIPVQRGARTGAVEKASKEFDLATKVAGTASAKALAARAARANMNDFDRFKALVARKKRGLLIRQEVNKLQRAAKK